jgi:FkbM family methyltransferase
MEPVPMYFERLTQTYIGYPDIKLLNIAIGPHVGLQEIYFVHDEVIQRRRSAGGDGMGQGVASFEVEHVRKCGYVDAEIDSVIVPVEPLSNVFASINNHVDVLLIDVEGAELAVVQSMDWAYPIDLIILETDHMSRWQRSKLEAILLPRGFRIFWRWPDSFAVNVRATCLARVLQDDELRLIALNQSDLAGVDGLTEIPFVRGERGAALLRDGWSDPEDHHTWSNGDVMLLDLPTHVGNMAVVACELKYAVYAPLVSQTITISINGTVNSKLKVPANADELLRIEHNVYVADLSSASMSVEIEVSEPVSPKLAGLSAEERHLGIALSSVRLVVAST